MLKNLPFGLVMYAQGPTVAYTACTNYRGPGLRGGPEGPSVVREIKRQEKGKKKKKKKLKKKKKRTKAPEGMVYKTRPLVNDTNDDYSF